MKAKGWTYKENLEQMSKKKRREEELAAYLNSFISTDLE